jgi:tetratricopeptide (TPR) repeat protein
MRNLCGVVLLLGSLTLRLHAALPLEEGRELYEAGCIPLEVVDFSDITDCRKAVQLLREAVTANPQSAEAHLLLAKALGRGSVRDSGANRREAETLLRRALELKPLFPDASYALYALTADPEALAALLLVAPGEERAHEMLLEHWITRGGAEQLLQGYQAFRQRMPLNSVYQGEIDAKVAQFLANQNHPDGERIYTQMLDTFRNEDPELVCLLFRGSAIPNGLAADVRQRLERYRTRCLGEDQREAAAAALVEDYWEDAARIYTRVIREYPAVEETYVRLARVYLEHNQTAQATAVLQSYLKMESDPVLQCRLLPEFGDLRRYPGLALPTQCR